MTRAIALLAFVPSLAAAYNLKRDAAGEIVQWNGRIEFVVDSNVADALGELNAFDAVKDAIRELDDAAPGLDVSYRAGATLEIGYDLENPSKNQNDIVVLSTWPYEKSVLAVTIVTLNARSNEI